LKAGALVELLQDFSAGGTGLQVVYPATQDQPKRVRLLIDRIAEAFATLGSEHTIAKPAARPPAANRNKVQRPKRRDRRHGGSP